MHLLFYVAVGLDALSCAFSAMLLEEACEKLLLNAASIYILHGLCQLFAVYATARTSTILSRQRQLQVSLMGASIARSLEAIALVNGSRGLFIAGRLFHGLTRQSVPLATAHAFACTPDLLSDRANVVSRIGAAEMLASAIGPVLASSLADWRGLVGNAAVGVALALAANGLMDAMIHRHVGKTHEACAANAEEEDAILDDPIERDVRCLEQPHPDPVATSRMRRSYSCRQFSLSAAQRDPWALASGMVANPWMRVVLLGAIVHSLAQDWLTLSMWAELEAVYGLAPRPRTICAAVVQGSVALWLAKASPAVNGFFRRRFLRREKAVDALLCCFSAVQLWFAVTLFVAGLWRPAELGVVAYLATLVVEVAISSMTVNALRTELVRSFPLSRAGDVLTAMNFLETANGAILPQLAHAAGGSSLVRSWTPFVQRGPATALLLGSAGFVQLTAAHPHYRAAYFAKERTPPEGIGSPALSQ